MITPDTSSLLHLVNGHSVFLYAPSPVVFDIAGSLIEFSRRVTTSRSSRQTSTSEQSCPESPAGRRRVERLRWRIGIPKRMPELSCIEPRIRLPTSGEGRSSSTAIRCGRGDSRRRRPPHFGTYFGTGQPPLPCPECPNDDVLVGQKAADGAKIQRWFDCPECGYEGRSKIVYGAER